MYEGDRYLFRSRRGENVPANLEKCKRKGCGDDVASRRANTMPQSWNRMTNGRESTRNVRKKNTPNGDKGELDYGQRDRLGIGVKD